jgi:hypothetical protein
VSPRRTEVIRRTRSSCWSSRPGAQAPITTADTAMITPMQATTSVQIRARFEPSAAVASVRWSGRTEESTIGGASPFGDGLVLRLTVSYVDG